jgi:putative membrane protein
MSGAAGDPVKRAAVAILVTVLATAGVILFFGAAAYLWVKAVHLIAVISWMAGMLYLPRLFVYHCEAERGSELSEKFKIMERRLLRAIINPAMIVTWVLGLWLAWQGRHFSSGWFHVKLAAVIVLSGVHGYLSASVRRFAEDANAVSARTWRIINEVPAVLMVIIVLMAVAKPF